MRRAMQFRRIAMIDISRERDRQHRQHRHGAHGLGILVAGRQADRDVGLDRRRRLDELSAGCPDGRSVTPDVKELVGFGMGVTGFTMTDYVAKSADRLAIGYFYGAGPLGYFQNAFTIYNNLLSILTEPLHNIAVSGLSKLRNDVDELKRSWATALSTVSFFSAAAFAVLAVTGQDFVVMLLGEKWAPAGPLLCIFAVQRHRPQRRTHAWDGFTSRPDASDRWMRWGIFSAACQLMALAAGLPFGVIGVATAYAIVMFGLFVPALVYAGRPLGIGTKDVLAATGPQTVAALCAVAVGLLLQQALMAEFAPSVRFALSGLICLITYLAVAVGVLRVTGPMRLALSLLREFQLRQSPKAS